MRDVKALSDHEVTDALNAVHWLLRVHAGSSFGLASPSRLVEVGLIGFLSACVSACWVRGRHRRGIGAGYVRTVFFVRSGRQPSLARLAVEKVRSARGRRLRLDLTSKIWQSEGDEHEHKLLARRHDRTECPLRLPTCRVRPSRLHRINQSQVV